MGSVGFFGGRRPPPENENEFRRFLLEKKVQEVFLAAEGRQKKKNQRMSAFLSIFFACGALVPYTYICTCYQYSKSVPNLTVLDHVVTLFSIELSHQSQKKGIGDLALTSSKLNIFP